MEQAVDYLRKKGLAAASKKAGRAATEGMVATALTADNSAGVLVEINSETDFVAKNDKFQTFVKQVADHVLQTKPATLEELLAQPFVGDSAKTVQTLLTEAISVIGENLQIRRFALFTAEGGAVGSYIHAGGKIGVLVEVGCDNATVRGMSALQPSSKMWRCTLQPHPPSSCSVPKSPATSWSGKRIFTATRPVRPANRKTSSRRSSKARSTSSTAISVCWSKHM